MRVDWGDQKHRGNDHACVQTSATVKVSEGIFNSHKDGASSPFATSHTLCASRDGEIADSYGNVDVVGLNV